MDGEVKMTEDEKTAFRACFERGMTMKQAIEAAGIDSAADSAKRNAAVYLWRSWEAE